MPIVGRIDRNIYRVVTPDITTEEVIITDEQLAHIEKRHPGDYLRFSHFIPQMTANPAYILEDSNPYTAVVLERFEEDDHQFQLILRIHTISDPDGYKNSIITFMRISAKRYKEYLANKKILYKRE